MSTIGRNDPCPCGSGKKYKKCCGAASPGQSDAAYERVRRMDGLISGLLTEFAKMEYGNNALRDAWEEFAHPGDMTYSESHPEYEYFLRWFAFSWMPDDDLDVTLPEIFLMKKVARVDAEVRQFIGQTLKAPYSFYQVVGTTPGSGMKMRDILRHIEVDVTERAASAILQPGHIVFARVVEMDGISFLMGVGGYPLPATMFDQVIRVRSDVEAYALKAGLWVGPRDGSGGVSTEVLLDVSEELREEYLQLADQLRHPNVVMHNTDGDVIVMHKLTYTTPSFEVAFQALKDLELNLAGITEEELREANRTGGAGEAEGVRLHWLKQQKDGQEIAMATLTITGSTLVVEVNSEKRFRRVQREITKRMGKDAVLLKTEILSEEGLKAMAAESRGAGREESERIMRESPDVRAFMKDMMEKHWSSWPDIPLPALRGMTPRQAAKDPLGRELLESVLLDFEAKAASLKDEFMRVDVNRLRRDLGLKEKNR